MYVDIGASRVKKDPLNRGLFSFEAPHTYNTFKDLELCVGDFTLDLAELYEVLISDILLLTSLSHAAEY